MSDLPQSLQRLLRAAAALESATPPDGDRQGHDAGTRLRDSVLRPLRQIQGATADTANGSEPPRGSAGGEPEAPAAAQPFSDRVWELARAATELRAEFPDLPELAEATAALQDLAIQLAGDSTAVQWLGELASLQSNLPPQIQVAHNGPYLVTNAANLYDWLGQVVPVRPQMALCRCGGSRIKPLCDGTHARIGFTDAKDPGRVPDRRDTYVGQQVTVLDNRGTCQHSGFCTDRLPTVFHLRQEPFVTPSGGRSSGRCATAPPAPSATPSTGEEARDEVDYHAKRTPAIEVSRDGPYRIVGGIALVDGKGEDVVRNEGASREHYALCRCGQSQNKPFAAGCTGTCSSRTRCGRVTSSRRSSNGLAVSRPSPA